MQEPLENIAIGNFLYGLGLSMGQRAGANAPPGCINLLQQTPLDRPLGDVLILFTGVIRLFEFKRHSADKRKEMRKLNVLQAAIRRRKDLQSLSRRIHWYVETRSASPDFQWQARSYLDMLDHGKPEMDFSAAIADVVNQALSAKTIDSGTLIQEYLDAVALFAGKRSGTSSGFLIAVSATGGIQWAAVDDICDFRETPAQMFDRLQLERQQARVMEQTVKRERVQGRKMGLERPGPSLDLSR